VREGGTSGRYPVGVEGDTRQFPFAQKAGILGGETSDITGASLAASSSTDRRAHPGFGRRTGAAAAAPEARDFESFGRRMTGTGQ